jgi:hypothetical protein
MIASNVVRRVNVDPNLARLVVQQASAQPYSPEKYGAEHISGRFGSCLMAAERRASALESRPY